MTEIAGNPIRVALTTPSSSISSFPVRTRRALRAMEGAGYDPVLSPLALWSDQRRPTARDLAEDLMWCFTESGADLVMATTGGRRAVELVEHLDMVVLAAAGPRLCGFSDVTALLVPIHAATGAEVLHGPTLLPSFGDADGVDPYTVAGLSAVLAGPAPGWLTPPSWTSSESLWWDWEDHRPRRRVAAGAWSGMGHDFASGPLLGGHLSTLVQLHDAGLMPSVADRIVFVESNLGSAAAVCSDLDRLRSAGLDQALGLVVGRAAELDRSEELTRWLEDYHRRTGAPVVRDVDLGHTTPILTLALGRHTTLDPVSGGIRIGVCEAVRPSPDEPLR